jgi:hypothetical protein
VIAAFEQDGDEFPRMVMQALVISTNEAMQ